MQCQGCFFVNCECPLSKCGGGENGIISQRFVAKKEQKSVGARHFIWATLVRYDFFKAGSKLQRYKGK